MRKVWDSLKEGVGGRVWRKGLEIGKGNFVWELEYRLCYFVCLYWINDMILRSNVYVVLEMKFVLWGIRIFY